MSEQVKDINEELSTNERLSIVTTAVTGATGGGVIGAMIAGPIGAIIGAGIGSIISGYSDYRHQHHTYNGSRYTSPTNSKGR